MSIQEQIQELTEELRPYPNKSVVWLFENEHIVPLEFDPESTEHKRVWVAVPFASINKAEVEEYADCYRRLKLYQLLGKKAEREHPLDFENADIIPLKGTDFGSGSGIDGYIEYTKYYKPVPCVLAGVWFSREEDRLEALKICGITKELQEKCAKYKLGGA